MAKGKTTKGEPFSVRFSAPTDRAVADEARRVRRSKGAVVEALTEEAMRTRRFPGLAFRGEDARRGIGGPLPQSSACRERFSNARQTYSRHYIIQMLRAFDRGERCQC